MNPLTQSKNTTILAVLIALTVACFALSPPAQAVCQDACLTNNNTVQGDDALISLTTGFSNTAMGFQALLSDTTGYGNTAIGNSALFSTTTGIYNTAIGSSALAANTAGGNTAIGFIALASNTTGGANTATGALTLIDNTSGSNNTADGNTALYFNETGNNNTATGVFALYNNRTGSDNTANGYQALFTSRTGIDNTANGSGALFSNRFGSHNTAIGFNALYNNKTGAFNIALGDSAGFNTTGRNNIDIGNQGMADESNTIRIGTVGTQTATFVAGISGVTVAGGVGVVIDTNGQLGTVVSSARFKDKIKPMDKDSEVILALKPVTFRYKRQLDPDGIPQFGLVAEDVATVAPELVVTDEHGQPFTVRTEAVNAMLLNEFLKEHRKVEEQGAIIARQQKQIEALTAGLQKVSAQLELSKSTPQTVLNDQ